MIHGCSFDAFHPVRWPNDAVIVWRRGKLHRQMCNTALAHRDFLKVLELRPDSKMAKEEVTVACFHIRTAQHPLS